MASRVARGLTPCPLWACQLLPARGSSVCVPDPPCPRALGPAAPSVGNTPSSYLLNDRASELMSEPYRPHRKSDRLRPPPSPPPAARAPVLGRQSQPGPAGRSSRPRSQGAAAPDPAAQTTQQRHRETSVKAAGSGRIAQQPGSARRDSRPTGPRGRRKRLSSRRTKSWAVSYSSRSLGRGGGGAMPPAEHRGSGPASGAAGLTPGLRSRLGLRVLGRDGERQDRLRKPVTRPAWGQPSEGRPPPRACGLLARWQVKCLTNTSATENSKATTHVRRGGRGPGPG